MEITIYLLQESLETIMIIFPEENITILIIIETHIVMLVLV